MTKPDSSFDKFVSSLLAFEIDYPEQKDAILRMLQVAFHFEAYQLAYRAKLKRPDLSEDNRRETTDSAQRYLRWLMTCVTSDQISSKTAVEMAFHALVAGAESGFTQDEIAALKAIEFSARGRNSAKNREAARQPLKKRILHEACEFRRLHPTISQELLLNRILDMGWFKELNRVENLKPRTILSYIRKFEKDGDLARAKRKKSV